MRVLHVIESFAAGGIETTFLNVLRAFRRLDPGARHDVLAFGGGALEAPYREAAEGVTVGYGPETIDWIVANGYDVLYILFERCAYRLLPALVARSTTPVVYGKGYDMGGMYRLNEGLRWQAEESMLAASDGVTFTTRPLAAGYVLPPGRATVLGKAADVARFSALATPGPDTPRRIVCVANLHPRKRIADLVHALAHVRARVPEAELRIVGKDGGEEASLRALAAELGLDAHVTFAGGVADVAPELAAARVIALPSSCEGVPTALLEGMAAGRPVVATDVGHVSSIVDDGIEGFLIRPGDIATLADRLSTLLGDDACAEQMGIAARARAQTHDVGAIAATLLATLRSAA